jgi:antitoxin CptB
MSFNDPEHNRIRWQCRRGMLELDLLLSEFLETAYPRLDPSIQQSFHRLLEQPDQTLQRWLLGDGSHVASELQQIVQILRKRGVERL